MKSTIEKVSFPGHQGQILAGRLDRPAGPVKAYALFAHCFTCGKDIFAASRIASALTQAGIAVLRFDFTGLGASEGEFGNAGFSSNVADLLAAADYLKTTYQAVDLNDIVVDQRMDDIDVVDHQIQDDVGLEAARHQ